MLFVDDILDGYGPGLFLVFWEENEESAGINAPACDDLYLF